jgi:ATP-dependent Clp protease ATP-binding subunit ClpC
MFERYNEKARRTIFFGRYEASQFGCETIEADFLLLGIAREDPSVCVRWLGANYVELRKIVARHYTRGEQIATSVDLPLSNTSKRVLAYAAEEAERMGHRHIGTEHLFLGLLREPDCTAAKVLKAQGENFKSVRAAIAQEPTRSEARPFAPPFSSVNMRLVDEDGSDVAVIPWHGRVPNIGEAIRIPQGDGGETICRVRDLCWRVKNSAGGDLRISEILLTVCREQP